MKSMTGFGKADFISEDFDINVTVKSINNKFLDIKISIPEELYPFENEFSKIVEKYIKRGGVFVKIYYKSKKNPKYHIDMGKLDAINAIYKDVQSKLAMQNSTLSLTNLMANHEIITQLPEQFDDAQKTKIISVLEEALGNHTTMAKKEGNYMKQNILSSMKTMEDSLEKVRKEYPVYKKLLREKLENALKNIVSEPFDREIMQRFLLELSFYMEKSDVTEEIVRLESHFLRMKKTLESDNGMGKKLNFILQEMKREINTTGSKFTSTAVFGDVIIIKEEIEKCREIVQNVE